MDNLESQTYEVFEKDPFKYSQYQKVDITRLSFNSTAIPVDTLLAGDGGVCSSIMWHGPACREVLDSIRTITISNLRQLCLPNFLMKLSL